jgi:uncharacterized membrane protein
MNETKIDPSSNIPEPIEDDKVIAAIAYLGILFLIPLLLKKNSKFAIYHARQGLVLFALEVGLWLLSLGLAYSSAVTLQRLVLTLWVGVTFVALYGLVQALRGNWWKLPSPINLGIR